jgi:hypothetical protein
MPGTSRPYGTFLLRQVTFYSTNMVFACANNLMGLSRRDKILVESILQNY